MSLFVRFGENVLAQFDENDLGIATRGRPGVEVPEGAELVHVESGEVIARRVSRASTKSSSGFALGWMLEDFAVDLTSGDSSCD